MSLLTSVARSVATALAVLLIGTATISAQDSGNANNLEILAADVLHGTVQAQVDSNGELILALDRKRSEFDKEDGIADLVVIAAPVEGNGLESLMTSFAEPAENATLIMGKDVLRVSTPTIGRFELRMGEVSKPEVRGRSDRNWTIPVVGMARYPVQAEALPLDEVIEKFSNYGLIQGSVTTPDILKADSEKSWSCTTGGPGTRRCEIGCPLGFTCSVGCWIGYYACCSCYTGCRCVRNGTSPP